MFTRIKNRHPKIPPYCWDLISDLTLCWLYPLLRTNFDSLPGGKVKSSRVLPPPPLPLSEMMGKTMGPPQRWSVDRVQWLSGLAQYWAVGWYVMEGAGVMPFKLGLSSGVWVKREENAYFKANSQIVIRFWFTFWEIFDTTLIAAVFPA